MVRAGRLVATAAVLGPVVGFALLHAYVLAPEPYHPVRTFRFPWMVLFATTLLIASYATGLPDLVRSAKAAVGATVVALAVSVTAVSLAQLALGAPLIPRSVVLGASACIVPLQLVAWKLSVDGRRRSETRLRAVLVADADSAAELRADLKGEVEQPAALVAHLPVALVREAPAGARPLSDLVTARRANMVVLDVAAQADPSIVTEAAELHATGVRIRTLSLFTEEFLGKIPIGELERVSLLFDVGELHRLRYSRVKRVAEVALAVAALPVLVVAAGVVLLGNRVANPGPLLYRQARIGKAGQVFTIYKFRSMRPEPAAGHRHWTSDGDPRVTRFGGMLRRTHLDELPQVVNILRGDLSLIGPRPEQPHYVERLRDKIPFYDVRHLIRPGLTGWAQVKYRYGADEQDALEKLQYDFYYLRRQSLVLDARIVARTLRRVAGARGR
jgi:lipopolysaccharide/colanic/teichoic acid biosynthesis glycosyltransferase